MDFLNYTISLLGNYRGGRRENNYYRNSRGRGHRGRQDFNSHPPENTGKTSLKYDSEFDFETANARFRKDALEEEFKQKLRVDGSSRKTSESNGDGIEGLPDDDDVVVIEEELEEGEFEEPVESEEYYDKTKSFFDNISCEANIAGNNR